jgi:hypothetical protein
MIKARRGPVMDIVRKRGGATKPWRAAATECTFPFAGILTFSALGAYTVTTGSNLRVLPKPCLMLVAKFRALRVLYVQARGSSTPTRDSRTFVKCCPDAAGATI